MAVGASVLGGIKIYQKGTHHTYSCLVYECTSELPWFCWFHLAIAGTLEAEKERRKSGLSSRVQFRNQGSEPKYTQVLTLSRQKQKVCMEETLWLQVRAADRSVLLKGDVEISDIYTSNPFSSTKESIVLEFPGSKYSMLNCISAYFPGKYQR